MANPKNVSALSKKRGRNTATVSPTSYDLTQDESKRRKKHKLSSIGVPVDSTILSAPDLYKKSRRNAVGDTRDDSSIEKVLVSEDGIETKSSGPLSGFDGLSIETRTRRGENQEQAALRLEKMQGAVRTLLECIGEDPSRSGLLDTPSRYAKALLFLTQGYHVNVEEIVNNALFQEGHNEMVIVKDIDIFSLCEHHLMHIGYIPSNTVIGLSKLPRIAEVFAHRLQIQERLTKQVARAIMKILKPQGVAVIMESSHLCMVMRGVEKTNTTTLTSCMLGCFERKSKTRNEFMHFVGVSR
ncbi:GTP cyclohydrolase I domain-containing protein [Trichoderma breve]|uniref:GTP cyclohydrolase 1 n=1 Tax=Trichoderma breve TaxID=2034170 RepID=A0A9W9EF68_9HYPO|nr:GTP cyclohydrolase I domain-containing protein [Trichoderma breve]KAJ4865718.1 GTP cyclohydrolase I domain-containing protein [Trichoderma breve]